MNLPVANFANERDVQLVKQTVSELTFQRSDKFSSSAQKEAYRKKAIQEIRRALKKSRDF